MLVLLLQLGTLLVLARTLSEVMRRLGQPAVLGELLAGILLGPTVLGHWAPGLFAIAFPQDPAQFHLLEVVSWLGMVLLLLLTGIETDVRGVRSLGRAALMASVFGMVVPFASGLALGWLLPDAYLADPAHRPLFAAFLATAMAISAMPVIAKILIDLNMLRRDVGMVILSAGVVDDTTGWLILSVIAGIATGGGFRPADLVLTLVLLALFLAAMRWLVYPATVAAIGYVNERVDLAGADLTLILGLTFLAAAATEAIGVHAVFGAFVAGLLIRQVSRVSQRTLHVLEVFVLSALSPVFFAFVGLKSDLWALSGWELPVVVISVAVAGKLVGCYLGGRLGRLSHWESLALGFGMNARGAMGLIVALIGLSLGLLTQEMYSTIVMVAVTTSFMAPLLLRWAVPKIPLTEEERRRLEDTGRPGLIPAGRLRVLIPTAGGPNAMAAVAVAAALVRAGRGQATALYVDAGATEDGWQRRILPRRPALAGTNLEQHFRSATEIVARQGSRLLTRQVRAADVAEAVLDEAGRDYDLLMLGAAPEHALHDPLTQQMVRRSPVPVVIVRQIGPVGTRPFQRILVPIDGSLFSRYAAELAFACAGVSGAEVRVLHVLHDERLLGGSVAVPERGGGHAVARDRIEAVEANIGNVLGPLAAARGASMSVRVLASGSPGEIIVGESRSGSYDLLVLGAENKLLGRPLFFGQGTAEIMDRAGCTTAVLIPKSE